MALITPDPFPSPYMRTRDTCRQRPSTPLCNKLTKIGLSSKNGRRVKMSSKLTFGYRVDVGHSVSMPPIKCSANVPLMIM